MPPERLVMLTAHRGQFPIDHLHLVTVRRRDPHALAQRRQPSGFSKMTASLMELPMCPTTTKDPALLKRRFSSTESAAP